MKKRVLLVDGNLMMFKSFYATNQPGSNYWFYNGKHVGGIRVFLQTLASLIQYIEPTHMLIAFDTDTKTFRHNDYDDYKAGRNKVDERIFEEFDITKEILDGLNIKRLEIPHFEADDIIATASKIFNSDEAKVYVYSSDKDMYQMLVAKNIEIFSKNTKTKEYDHLNHLNFKDFFGIEPGQIVDYKAIAGDTSDNLPGVYGIGSKGAINLLNKYGSLDNIWRHLDELTPKMQEKFNNSKEMSNKCKFLAQLRYDVPMDIYDFSLEVKIKKYTNAQVIQDNGLENLLERFY